MNQIFTEIIAKIKDIPLYEAILFLLYFSFSLQFNLFGIKYIITIIFLEFICCVCKNLFGNDLSHESSKEFYCLMLIIFLFGIIMNNIQFHSFKWLRIALNKLFSIKIEKVRVLTKYLNTLFLSHLINQSKIFFLSSHHLPTWQYCHVFFYANNFSWISTFFL